MQAIKGGSGCVEPPGGSVTLCVGKTWPQAEPQSDCLRTAIETHK